MTGVRRDLSNRFFSRARPEESGRSSPNATGGVIARRVFGAIVAQRLVRLDALCELSGLSRLSTPTADDRLGHPRGGEKVGGG